jgi:peptidoglycan hydrolase CwlO-like protein
MNEVIKISEEELAEVKMLQSKLQEMHFQFGNLQVEKMELDRLLSEFVSKEKSMKEDWYNLQKLEQTLLDKIVQNYGEGNLDMKDGTFTTTSAKT